ncbi:MULTISPECIES: resolvase [Cyanophyceae]|uniref:resolvase n=1 Tax=Cyanophyceae TaxID=3028117 RepID=UPI001F55208A|nr:MULTISPECIES: resolvase [Cyanophyceae]
MPPSPFVSNSTDGAPSSPTSGWIGTTEDTGALLSVDAVQKYLNRSRASVYRYANTDANTLNPPYDKTKLNPEVRRDKDDPLEFRPQEVRRFAEEVLGLHPTIQVQPPEETLTHDLMRQVLQEMRAIRLLLEERGSGEARR